MKMQIGVIGPSLINYQINPNAKELEEIAEKIGGLIAKADAILFTGGADGIMEVASRGAKNAGGLVVGTPGPKRKSSNKFVDVEVLTPISTGDFLFAGILSSDVIIIIGESAGTTAELALAYRYKKQMIIVKGISKYYDSLIGKSLDNNKCTTFLGVNSPEEAVELAIKIAKENVNKPNITKDDIKRGELR
ncbi:hypothetical protein GOV13_00345 [Candidatus Pacearchaeota archaeon]|nr:hypothetical protein [Candidatus Pacearchaeota archaeon]